MKPSTHKTAFGLCLAGMLCLSGFMVLRHFPSHAAASIWKGYRVLVVSAEASESEILERLEGQGISDPVTRSSSMLRNTSEEAPYQPFLGEVNARRDAWFLDPEGKYRYFYLREAPFLEKRVADGLAGAAIYWHLETTGGFAYFPLVLTVLMSLSGLVFAKNRPFQTAAGLPFIFLSFSCNRPSGLVAAILAQFALIQASDLLSVPVELTRAQLLRRFRAQPLVPAAAVAALLAALTGGPQSFLLFSAASVSSASAFHLARRAALALERRRAGKRLHPAFRPHAIRGETVSRDWNRALVIAVSASALAFALTGLLLFAFRSVKTDSVREKDLYIPSPSRYTGSAGFDLAGYTALAALKDGGGIPDLGDFVASQWRIRTFAWQRVQKPVVDPAIDTVAEYTDYTIDGNGVISEKKRILETFDTGFIRKTLSSDSTPLEKMLLSQDRFVTVARTDGTGNHPQNGGGSALWYALYLAIPGAALVMRLKK